MATKQSIDRKDKASTHIQSQQTDAEGDTPLQDHVVSHFRAAGSLADISFTHVAAEEQWSKEHVLLTMELLQQTSTFQAAVKDFHKSQDDAEGLDHGIRLICARAYVAGMFAGRLQLTRELDTDGVLGSV